MLSHQVVMVTGAGGSIGSELCRQIVKESPRQLVLVDHNEFGLYSIHRELQERCQAGGYPVSLVPFLLSVQNVTDAFLRCRDLRPSIIYHAAAYKHVPLVETNIAEAVLNNVFGTTAIARVAIENRVTHLVLVSTDKAVRPTNVMGATKRIAEQVLQALAALPEADFGGLNEDLGGLVPCSTRFSMVRFGNVLGSSGSVVPLFRKQIEAGGARDRHAQRSHPFFHDHPRGSSIGASGGSHGSGR